MSLEKKKQRRVKVLSLSSQRNKVVCKAGKTGGRTTLDIGDPEFGFGIVNSETDN